MLRKVVIYFDKLEDKIRAHLSKFPIIYTLIGGVAVVLFWRGVWHTADMLAAKGGVLGFLLYEPVSLLLVIVVLLATGLFVSYFIGDSILLSGAKSQKKLAEKTEKELRDEEASLNEIKHVVDDIKHELDDIKREVAAEHAHHHGRLVKEKEIVVKK